MRNARALGLTGWVRNEADGTVKALLQGNDAAVRRVVEQMRDGPAAARVERINQQECAQEARAEFSRR